MKTPTKPTPLPAALRAGLISAYQAHYVASNALLDWIHSDGAPRDYRERDKYPE